MRTFVALYVLSTVIITAKSQAAVTLNRPPREESDFYSNPWIPMYDNARTEAWGIGPEDIYNTDKWNNRGNGLKRILGTVFDEGRNSDWRYRSERVTAGNRDNIYDGSRVVHFGTTEGNWELRNRANVDRSLRKPPYEEHEDLPYQTNNWTPNTNIRNVDENDKLHSIVGSKMPENRGSISWDMDGNSKLHLHDETQTYENQGIISGNVNGNSKLQMSENRGSISWNVDGNSKLHLPGETQMYENRGTISGNVDGNSKLHLTEETQMSENRGSISWNVEGKSKLHLPDETQIYENQGTTSGNVDGNSKLHLTEETQMSEKRGSISWNTGGNRKLLLTDETHMHENQDSISGNVSQEIAHKDRLWPQNNQEKNSTVNAQEIREVDRWPGRRSFTQKNNDYWYISEAHPGVAFVLPGLLLADPHFGLLNGEWLRNTATAEMGDDLPWERNEKYQRKVTSERPDDISPTTLESKWNVNGTTEEVLTPDHLEHSKR